MTNLVPLQNDYMRPVVHNKFYFLLECNGLFLPQVFPLIRHYSQNKIDQSLIDVPGLAA